jgi:hypothetical protein
MFSLAEKHPETPFYLLDRKIYVQYMRLHPPPTPGENKRTNGGTGRGGEAITPLH